jgi:alpha-L-rhamnosidase
MLNIKKFTCENLTKGCVTDEKKPSFSFSLESDKENINLKRAKIKLNNWTKDTCEQIGISYDGMELQPFTEYTAELMVTDTIGETAASSVSFETGRMELPWKAKWITDGSYFFKEKRVSPVPMTFRKSFNLEKKVAKARIYATAMGIYELILNGKKVGADYFSPGFTSYKTRLQYQTYDVTALLKTDNTLFSIVGGGWAVGSFVFTRKNRVSADRQALLLELRLTYEDGTEETIGTDESWKVTEEGNYREADFYDGEIYDSTIDIEKITWRSAVQESLRIKPEIIAAYGPPVTAHEKMLPVFCGMNSGELIYDFGQNFAGLIHLKIFGKKGQEITVKHAEILHADGSLNTKFLRTAKARIVYTCSEGEQEYSPKFTYMGFRYISISGISKENIEVSAWALYSDLDNIGEFNCSNKQINQLQQNILWSAKSNFVDIPTDCPQRDERMGWTGDIAVFSKTACYNFDMSRFLNKWLLDVISEQKSTGGIPNTVPAQGYGFPATMPVMAVDFWGDACVLVPWAEYIARGDIKILKKCYPMMKKYVEACKFWAGLFSVGKHKYIWNTLHLLHFGDWVAPDVPNMSQWQKRSKWTATASLKNTSEHLGKIAGILGYKQDEEKYYALSKNVANAYRDIFTDGNGKLNNEFQTAYVLPLYFNMLPEKESKEAAKNLVRLVKEAEYKIGTGFPGTPYILFALADQGYEDVAYKMLLNDKCPSWLYQVKMGATTIWERWDGLDENGECPIGNDGTDQMISYNHYASGAVGDFFYRRIAGIEAIEPGYKKFMVAPILGGGIEYAKGSIEVPYGKIISDWKIHNDKFEIMVQVPVGTECILKLPNSQVYNLTNGIHTFVVLLSAKTNQLKEK